MAVVVYERKEVTVPEDEDDRRAPAAVRLQVLGADALDARSREQGRDQRGAGEAFDVPADPESVELRALLSSREPEVFVHDVTGIEPGHPLEPGLVAVVEGAKGSA